MSCIHAPHAIARGLHARAELTKLPTPQPDADARNVRVIDFEKALATLDTTSSTSCDG